MLFARRVGSSDPNTTGPRRSGVELGSSSQRAADFPSVPLGTGSPRGSKHGENASHHKRPRGSTKGENAAPHQRPRGLKAHGSEERGIVKRGFVWPLSFRQFFLFTLHDSLFTSPRPLAPSSRPGRPMVLTCPLIAGKPLCKRAPDDRSTGGCLGGTYENSPAIHRWVADSE